MTLLSNSIAICCQDTLKGVSKECACNAKQIAEQSGTNCNDIIIVLIICVAILLLALIIAYAMYRAKKLSYNHILDMKKEQLAANEKEAERCEKNRDKIREKIEHLGKIKSLCTDKDGKFDEAFYSKFDDLYNKIQ